jgi:DNA-binding transcriptional regulator YiaG
MRSTNLRASHAPSVIWGQHLLRNWEQGFRTPTGPARALLKALKNRPAEVVKALQAA